MTDSTVIVETRGRVGLMRINRPRQMNALNSEVMAQILAAVEAFDADPDIGAMVLAGNERAFAAGADIKEMAGMGVVDHIQSGRIAMWQRVRSAKKPIIAAVSGFCLGGGCELAMMCDMIVASETATFGQPEINLGIMPGAGGTQRLTRAVGKALAMEMVLNARFISAQEALVHGLVNRVVPVEHFLDEALTLAGEIAARAPLAVQLAKQAVNQAFETSLTEGLMDERYLFYMLFASQDQQEGMAAFVEKRPANWQGK
ncbi:MAG: enoyl-CoA hydratase/isomerase family protein [Anaerolineae bacterium]|nr:enoyl-CoA hydratase/isomerase family protein [Anaerolineae bacterium]MCB9129888.1 enoyl-CoA hydratase/isomerase family protein [Anaerolineales bacterium]MCB9140830.1 enoyl-CoA hydratase/isomerase family protein [Anaerolineales bacterium]MCO5246428.1 enoyl-CoA hydratase-related protein [Anaerolineae bacterium]